MSKPKTEKLNIQRRPDVTTFSREKIREMAGYYAKDKTVTWLITAFAQEICRLEHERKETV